MKEVVARRWPLLLAVWAYVTTSLCAAAVLSARTDVGYGHALLWQGLAYAAWTPLCWLGWRLGRGLGTPRREAMYFATAPFAIAAHAALIARLDEVMSSAPRDFMDRFVDRLPVDLLIHTAIGAALIAVAMARRAEAAARQTAQLRDALDAARAAPSAGEERLAVATGARGKTLVPLSEIEQITGAGNYAAVRWADREGLVRETLSGLAERLDPTVFLRIHRSAIVNLAKVRRAAPLADGAWRLELESGAEALVSRSYREALLARLPAKPS